MANELIVSTVDEGIRIAIMENKRLVELQTESRNSQFAVGDILLGRVTRMLPSLNAVFVDVGHERDGFLHYLDLGPQVKSQIKYLKQLFNSRQYTKLEEFQGVPDIDKLGKMADVLKPNQPVLVQVMKEPISTKGPRLSSQLSLPGQYIILMPFSSEVSVSRKFRSIEEKKRIKQLLEGICPPNVGLIVRTAAEGVEFEKLKADFDTLYAKWQRMCEEVMGAEPPHKVLSEMDRTSSILRDMLSIGFEAIYTDDQQVYKDLDEFLVQHQPENRRILHYKRTRAPLFESLGIERQIKAAFGKNVNLSNGAYLVIEHTEALHVIDVNSGSQRNLGDQNPEDNALRINLEAAAEISRQLRLRDMGGIIVIDFIDQRKPDNRRRVFQQLKAEMEKDRARHTILPMSRFGLVQITRQRVRPEVAIVTDETCPTCSGSGKVGPTIVLADQVENQVRYLLTQTPVKKLQLVTHPYLHAFFTKGLPSTALKWRLKYKKPVKVTADTSLGLNTVKYLDANGDEIKLD